MTNPKSALRAKAQLTSPPYFTTRRTFAFYGSHQPIAISSPYGPHGFLRLTSGTRLSLLAHRTVICFTQRHTTHISHLHCLIVHLLSSKVLMVLGPAQSELCELGINSTTRNCALHLTSHPDAPQTVGFGGMVYGLHLSAGIWRCFFGFCHCN